MSRPRQSSRDVHSYSGTQGLIDFAPQTICVEAPVAHYGSVLSAPAAGYYPQPSSTYTLASSAPNCLANSYPQYALASSHHGAAYAVHYPSHGHAAQAAQPYAYPAQTYSYTAPPEDPYEAPLAEDTRTRIASEVKARVQSSIDSIISKNASERSLDELHEMNRRLAKLTSKRASREPVYGFDGDRPRRVPPPLPHRPDVHSGSSRKDALRSRVRKIMQDM